MAIKGVWRRGDCLYMILGCRGGPVECFGVAGMMGIGPGMFEKEGGKLTFSVYILFGCRGDCELRILSSRDCLYRILAAQGGPVDRFL